MPARRWSPASKVNRDHLVTIASRGDVTYLSFVIDLLEQKLNGTPEHLEMVIEIGVDAGYLPADSLERITGSNNSAAQIAAAAAEDEARKLILTLLQGGQETAIATLIAEPKQPSITEESVAKLREQLAGVQSVG